MNALGTLLTVLAVIVGAVVLIPVLGVVLGLGRRVRRRAAVAVADRPHRGVRQGRERAEKILWILAIIFLSWFAWIFYFFFAPVFDEPQRHSYY